MNRPVALRPPLPLCHRILLGVLLAALLPTLLGGAGCAPTARFLRPRPADTPLLPAGRLAVTRFAGDPRCRDSAHALLVDRLQRSDRVALVHHDQLQQHARHAVYLESGQLNQPVAFEAARRLRLNRLLVGQVRIVEADGTAYGSKTFRIGDPRVRAVIHYQVLDVPTGHVVLDGSAESDSAVLEFEMSGSEAETEVLRELAEQAAIRLAQQLVPHDVTVTVDLATATFGKGTREIRAGNQAAAENDWRAAERHWLEALEQNPTSHAALHNLALACEARRAYGQAQRYLEAAIAQSDQPRYRQALSRVRYSMDAVQGSGIGGQGPAVWR